MSACAFCDTTGALRCCEENGRLRAELAAERTEKAHYQRRAVDGDVNLAAALTDLAVEREAHAATRLERDHHAHVSALKSQRGLEHVAAVLRIEAELTATRGREERLEKQLAAVSLSLHQATE